MREALQRSLGKALTSLTKVNGVNVHRQQNFGNVPTKAHPGACCPQEYHLHRLGRSAKLCVRFHAIAIALVVSERAKLRSQRFLIFALRHIVEKRRNVTPYAIP